MTQILLINNGVQEAHTVTNAPNEIALLDGNGELSPSTIPAIAGSGVIVQVRTYTKTDTFNGSVSRGNWIDIEGLCGPITPNDASSTVLINATVQVAMEKIKKVLAVRLVRDGTPVCVADGEGDRVQATSAARLESDKATTDMHFSCEDSPNTVNEVIYKVQMSQEEDKHRTVYVNRTKKDKNEDKTFRVVSTLTLMEVSA